MGKVKRVDKPIPGKIYYDRSCSSLVVVESIYNHYVNYYYITHMDAIRVSPLSWITIWWRKINAKEYHTW